MPLIAIAADGRATTSPPLAVDFLRDDETRARIAVYGGALIAATDVAAAAAWRRLALPAMPVAALAMHSQEAVSSVWVALNSLESVDSKTVHEARRNIADYKSNVSDPNAAKMIKYWKEQVTLDAALVVPLWDPINFQPLAPSTGEPLPILLYVQKQASQIRCGVGVWSPPTPTLSLLQQATAAADYAEVKRLLMDSLANDLIRIDHIAGVSSRCLPAPMDLVGLRSRLVQISSSELAKPGEQQRAKQAYLAKADEVLLAPFLESAAGSPGCEGGLLAWAQAAFARRLIEADIDFALKQIKSPGPLPTNAKDIAELCALGKQILEFNHARQETRHDNGRRRPARRRRSRPALA